MNLKKPSRRTKHDLNNVLNLNCEQAPSMIVQNRKAIYEECKNQLIKLQKSGKWKAGTLQKILRQYEQLDDGKKQEYVGVPVYLIQKYLKNCQR